MTGGDTPDTAAEWRQNRLIAPGDWIDAFSAAAKLGERLRLHTKGDDPAPWFNPPRAEQEAFALGKDLEEYQHSQKFNERLVLTLQRALLAKEISASLRMGDDIRSASPSAFVRKNVVRNAFTIGKIELDPLWSDEWQFWNRASLILPSGDFDSWLASAGAVEIGDLPVLLDPASDIGTIVSRLPSIGKYVSLSEAVSFIAFGFALDSERLERAGNWMSLCDGDLKKAGQMIAEALEKLLEAGANEQITFEGRYIQDSSDHAPHYRSIDRLELHDYRQMLIEHDILFYGCGLREWLRAPNDYISPKSRLDSYHYYLDVNSIEPKYHFENVSVNRDQLMEFFGNVSTITVNRGAGRPNKRKEAIELHRLRLKSGDNIGNLAQESREIQKLLAKKHASEVGWSYKWQSIVRVLSDLVKLDK